MSAEAVIDAARRLVKHNACLTAAALKLSKTPYPPTPPTCECTYCKLKAALDAFDLETAARPQSRSRPARYRCRACGYPGQ